MNYFLIVQEKFNFFYKKHRFSAEIPPLWHDFFRYFAILSTKCA